MDNGDFRNQPPNRIPFGLDALERMFVAQFPEHARVLIVLLRLRTYHGVDDPLLSYLSHAFGRYFTGNVNNIVNDNVNNIVNDNVEHDRIIRPEVEVIQEVEASDDPQPEASRRRQREEEDEDEGTRSKRFRWWDEFDDTDSESDTDDEEDDVPVYTDSESDTDDEEDDVPVYHQVSQAEQGDLPGTSRKRSRENDEDDDSQDNKHCRLWKKRERDDDEDGDARSPKHFRFK